jgi:CDGSH iron-sulfur domain-containing protein 3
VERGDFGVRQAVRIKIRKNGPYLVTGTVDVVDHQGNVVQVGEDFVLCRCGQSATKPFCDGSHKGVGFDDET